MDPQRLVTLLRDLYEDHRTGADVGARLSTACVDELHVTGAGIMLVADGQVHSTLGVSNAVGLVIQDLQLLLGEGPGLDACRTSLPIVEPDLRNPATNRWPAFSGPAVDAGVRAVFSFPLRAGARCLGALDLYLDQPEALSPALTADALVLADVTTSTVLELQAGAAPGTLAHQLSVHVHHRAVLHQAAGMVSAQLDIGVDDALVVLRAHAYTQDQSVIDVARAVVDRHLRLD